MESTKIVAIVRFLNLILEHRNHLTVEQAAKCMRVHSRTIYRYVETLNSVGFDVSTKPIVISQESRGARTLLQLAESLRVGAQNVYSLLYLAIEKKRRIRLLHYASSRTRQWADYLLEPYGMSDDCRFLYAYDINAQACKVFKISRMTEVLVIEEPWQLEKAHCAVQTDLFSMHHINKVTSTDSSVPSVSSPEEDSPAEVSLKLNIHAYHLLLEEFPMVVSHPLAQLTPIDDKTWRLDVKVFSYKGVGRFYFGLADEIEILSGEGFRLYVRDFASRYCRN